MATNSKKRKTKKRGLGGLDQPLFMSVDEIQQNITDNIIDSVITASSAIAGSLGLQAAKNKFSNPTAQKVFGKFGGMLLLGSGIAANATGANTFVKAAGNGLTAVGAIQTVFDQNVSFGAKMSVAAPSFSGIGQTYSDDVEIDDDMDEYIRQLVENTDAEFNGIKGTENLGEVQEAEMALFD